MKKQTILVFIFIGLVSSLLHSGAIHRAAKEGCQRKVAKLLLKNPMLLNQQDEEGRTALHWAAWKGFENLVLFLLKSGANTSLRDENTCLALELAYLRGYLWLSEVIQHYHHNEYGDDEDSLDENKDLAAVTAPPRRPTIFEIFQLSPILPYFEHQ